MKKKKNYWLKPSFFFHTWFCKLFIFIDFTCSYRWKTTKEDRLFLSSSSKVTNTGEKILQTRKRKSPQSSLRDSVSKNLRTFCLRLNRQTEKWLRKMYMWNMDIYTVRTRPIRSSGSQYCMLFWAEWRNRSTWATTSMPSTPLLPRQQEHLW